MSSRLRSPRGCEFSQPKRQLPARLRASTPEYRIQAHTPALALIQACPRLLGNQECPHLRQHLLGGLDGLGALFGAQRRRHGAALLHGGSRADEIQPALESRAGRRCSRRTIRSPPPSSTARCRRWSIPSPAMYVVVLQLPFHDFEQAARLALVAFDGVRNLLRRVAEEHVGLAHHRTDAAHLEHQPLHARVSAPSVRWAAACRSSRPGR